MIVGKRSADRHLDIESSRRRIEDEFGCGEGVVLMQLEDSVVETLTVGSFEIMQTEMEI